MYLFSTHVCTILLLLAIIHSDLEAQESIWGLDASGGGDHAGAIFQVDTNSGAYQELSSFFVSQPGKYPVGQLLPWRDKLLGTSRGGGKHDQGLLFAIDTLSGHYEVWHDFQDSTGFEPSGGMSLGSNGMLFGLCSKGGQNEVGVLYVFDPQSMTYWDVHHFDQQSGVNPWGNLLRIPDGRMLGTAPAGGRWGNGSLFAFQPSTEKFEVLHDFGRQEGSLPGEGLAFDGSDKVYGSTFDGGSHDKGTLFSYKLSDSSFQMLYAFDLSAWGPPSGPVYVQGKLWGTTWYGGQKHSGTLYSYDLQNQSFQVFYHLDDSLGWLIRGPLQYHNQSIWGLASAGGAEGKGSLFRLDIPQQTFRVLHALNDHDGSYPRSGLSRLGTRWFGLGMEGGNSGAGTLFVFDEANDHFEKVSDFSFGVGGAFPTGGLTLHGGKAYGLSSAGGAFGFGTLFEFNPLSGERRKLHDFDGINGTGSAEGLVEGPGGKLFGSAQQVNGRGLIFSLDPITGAYEILAELDSLTGSQPIGSLAIGPSGILYGYTREGGNFDKGTLFGYDLQADSLWARHSFAFQEGFQPQGVMIQASNGLWYGTTQSGGDNFLGGVLFEYNESQNKYRVLKSFLDRNTGTRPLGNVLEIVPGLLLGATTEGGFYGHGLLYTFDVNQLLFEVVHEFEEIEGTGPRGSLVYQNHKIFGICGRGGKYQHGSIFSYQADAGIFKNILDLDAQTALRPGAYLTLAEGTSPLGGEQELLPDFSLYPNPSQNRVWIKLDQAFPAPLPLRVVDIYGNTLIQKTLGRGGRSQYSIDLGELSPGTYLLKIRGYPSRKVIRIP